MKSVKFFERELNLINDSTLRTLVADYLEHATPNYFWVDGASSSGKYHPQFAQGVGGLVRHTKAVVMFAEELLRMSSYAYMEETYKDFVIAACILHDTIKYGTEEEINKGEYRNHARNAAAAFEKFCVEGYGITPHYLLLNAIRSHMGQWSTEKEDKPFTSVDCCVHMADYMASRSFIDIPSITADYNWTEYEVCREDLPFEFAEGA